MSRTSFPAIFVCLVIGCVPILAHAATQGSLVKLACVKKSDAADPCRAVYFYGHDGKRHAFSNDKVYFTWYADFSGVQTVSSATLASMPLGGNVTYRPGSKMVKFTTDPKVYAVSPVGTLHWVGTEALATSLYGPTWNKQIDDLSDAFYGDYQFGTSISSASDFVPTHELMIAATIDDTLPSTHRSISVTTTGGTFSIELIKLLKNQYKMVTDTGDGHDCIESCVAKSLSDYVTTANAEAAIHGSYFCPPDYADCATKVNTFLAPFFDTDGHAMINQGSMAVHEGSMLAYAPDDVWTFYHRTKDAMSTEASFQAAASNYPSLIENGVVVVQGETIKLDHNMQTVKSVRGGVGMDDDFVYLVIAKSATVPDLASIFQKLGATNALNLDGGGSGALWYQDAYVYGPGRNLPNAILFVKK